MGFTRRKGDCSSFGRALRILKGSDRTARGANPGEMDFSEISTLQGLYRNCVTLTGFSHREGGLPGALPRAVLSGPYRAAIRFENGVMGPAASGCVPSLQYSNHALLRSLCCSENSMPGGLGRPSRLRRPDGAKGAESSLASGVASPLRGMTDLCHWQPRLTPMDEFSCVTGCATGA